MTDGPWSRLSRSAWLAFVAHLAAGAAMALVLRHGLDTKPALIVAVAADWSAQAVEVFVLPDLARAANATGFLAWHRAAVVLTGFLANGLYTTSALLLVWTSRRAYPRWIQAAGFGVVAGGTILSAAAWVDSATGMLLANLLRVPSLLVWLAGVAASARPFAEIDGLQDGQCASPAKSANP